MPAWVHSGQNYCFQNGPFTPNYWFWLWLFHQNLAGLGTYCWNLSFSKRLFMLYCEISLWLFRWNAAGLGTFWPNVLFSKRPFYSKLLILTLIISPKPCWPGYILLKFIILKTASSSYITDSVLDYFDKSLAGLGTYCWNISFLKPLFHAVLLNLSLIISLKPYMLMYILTKIFNFKRTFLLYITDSVFDYFDKALLAWVHTAEIYRFQNDIFMDITKFVFDYFA